MTAACRWRPLVHGLTLAWLALALWLAPTWALAQKAPGQLPVPVLQGLASDQTGTLSAAQLSALNERLRAFEQRKGSQLALLMVASTQGEAIESYALRVAEQWKLGRKKVDDGALLLVAKEDRAVRIEVGYGLEGVLSDALTKRIISDTITPRFRAGDFYGGIDASLDRMMRLIDGEPLPPAAPAQRSRAALGSLAGLWELAPVLLVLAVVAGGILRAAFGRLPGALLTAGAAGFLLWLLSGLILAALIGAIVALLATLLGGGRHGGLPGLGGMHRGGGLGGGFGGGGFRGGGGGFGGGGSSGRW